jgi:hypothetical protein
MSILQHLYHVLISCMMFSFEKFGRLFDDTLNGRPGQEKKPVTYGTILNRVYKVNDCGSYRTL